MLTRRAVIDVGTNSVKLLVADVAGQTVHPLLEKSEQTRLGRGFYETHRLQPDAIAHTAQAVARFASEAGAFHPGRLRVIATSAARDAENQADLVDAIHRASGLPVQIITGDQEADWVYAGVTTDARLADVPLLILDIGGGSTEFILGKNAVQYFRQSFRLGTVRLLERLKVSDPPEPGEWEACQAQLTDFLAKEIRPALDPKMKPFVAEGVRLVSTGGTATILARVFLQTDSFDRRQLEATRLTRMDVAGQRQRLWSLPLAERKEVIGVPPDRADIILGGVAILSEVMEQFGFPDVHVSTRGLRFAAVLNAE